MKIFVGNALLSNFHKDEWAPCFDPVSSSYNTSIIPTPETMGCDLKNEIVDKSSKTTSSCLQKVVGLYRFNECIQDTHIGRAAIQTVQFASSASCPRTFGQEELGIKPLTLQLVDKLLNLLSHHRPINKTIQGSAKWQSLPKMDLIPWHSSPQKSLEKTCSL